MPNETKWETPTCAACQRPAVVLWRDIRITWRGLGLRINFDLCQECNAKMIVPIDPDGESA